MNHKNITIFLFIILLGSCHEHSMLEYQLPGTWKNRSMNVKIQSANNTKQDNTLDVPDGQWEAIMKIRPIETTYKKDGTFSSVYKNLKDSVINTSSGEWRIVEDQLMLITSGDSTTYDVKIEDKVATFKATLDWDQDGKKDDVYLGMQEKVK